MSDDTTEIEMPPGAHRLPSGGWVTLSDPTQASGKDVHAIRKCLDGEGVGSIGNDMLAAALAVRVIAWHIPNRPDLPLPRTNRTWLQLVGWEDTLALEELVEEWAQRIAFPHRFKVKDDGQPGGPPAPASE